jgi:murein DD-endopeptidase MepM/ murein hydrolase activator NlpD
LLRGSLDWIPENPSGRRRPIRINANRVRLLVFLAAGVMSLLLGGAFALGRKAGSGPEARSRDYTMLQGELLQLGARVENLQETLRQVAQREERAFTAAADLNLDFSGLLAQAPEREPLDMFQYIEDVELKLYLSERLADAELTAYDSLARLLVEKSDILRRTPSIWPVSGIFVSDFGARVDPFTGAVRYHQGIDISDDTGTPIHAPADGVVTFCGWSGGWGLNMVIKHTDQISTRYAHCSRLEVAVGQQVQRGDIIARVGSTGRSVGPHLHYEVLRNGVQVDPEEFIIRTGPRAAVF